MFKFGLKTKFTLLMVVIIFLGIAIVSFDAYHRSKNKLMDSLRSELIDLASSLVLNIDPNTIKAVLSGNESSTAYLSLKRKLNNFTRLGQGKINDAYILVPTPKKEIWEFVADSELQDPSKISHLHEKYEVSRFPEMKKSLTMPAADKQITTDKWGQWLSGYAPIFRQSKPFAVLGLDMRASDVEKLKQETINVTLLYLLFGFIFSIVLGQFSTQTIVVPILALINGVKEMKAKNFASNINLRRNDELGELIAIFNEMSAKLREVDKMKSDFLAVITHELYTPLTPIKGGAEQLKRMPGITDAYKQMVDMIERQAQKMQSLVDEILDFAWLDIKEWKLNLEPINLTLLAEEAIPELETALRSKNINFVKTFEPALPIVMGDKKRILHVIKILLENAIKFSADRGSIALKITKIAQAIECSVEDNGMGFSPENRAKLFEQFYQEADHLTRAHGGLGLGLPIAKRIIEAHGGKIWAESTGPGQGSRFTFSIPIQ